MDNEITAKLRLTSLLTDWLMMNLAFLAGGVIILAINFIVQLFTGSYLPLFINQLLLVIIIYIPWLGLHVWFDLEKGGSLGKQMFRLSVNYQNSNILVIVLRNVLKWIGTFIILSSMVHILFNEITTVSGILFILSFIWLLANILILTVNKGKWHFIDKIVNSQVNFKESLS
ncbi:RDD family protein [Aerococcaceae bacterium DSM 111176]|nr:RDD family protein [Aerococcaceae bacterium DSM 111176]